MKRIAIAFVLIVSIMISSCGLKNEEIPYDKQEISDAEAQDIMHDFYKSNYEYTATTYFVSKDGSEKVDYTYAYS